MVPNTSERAVICQSSRVKGTPRHFPFVCFSCRKNVSTRSALAWSKYILFHPGEDAFQGVVVFACAGHLYPASSRWGESEFSAEGTDLLQGLVCNGYLRPLLHVAQDRLA